MKKKWPVLKDDKEAERFVEEADLTEYDFSEMVPMRFEFENKTTRMQVRMPESQIKALKAEAKRRGMPYTRLVREFISDGLQTKSASRQAGVGRTKSI